MVSRFGKVLAPLFMLMSCPIPADAQEIPTGFHLAGDGDTLIHEGSGYTFPSHVGDFIRTDEWSRDPTGEYIAIRYDQSSSRGEPVVAYLAVVHIGEMSAHEHYAAIKPQAQRFFSAIELESEGPVKNPRVGKAAFRGTFRGERKGMPWEFSLTTVELGEWAGRLTAAYPATQAKPATEAIDNFIAAFPKTRQK
ncbi:MAG: hypothetical protein QHC67_17610 [Sphingobium sp.]|uniref:hypothetical protein n=1 Tax=Sphingobium sp. TaxID=1912891 RepID=UPI0029B30F3E|nr:hypothetical protein [Sphingobium sp.]MDX3911604.1 hypothetical protein [Sphingobium sp.]